MGYRRNPKVYKVLFAADSEYPGLEVQLRSLSIGQIIAARAASGSADSVQELVELLADRIVSWNLEDEKTGQPVPTTLDAIKAEDHDMVMAIINEWIEAVTGVSAPLERPSPAGGISPEVSIPMEPLSPSLAS